MGENKINTRTQFYSNKFLRHIRKISNEQPSGEHHENTKGRKKIKINKVNNIMKIRANIKKLRLKKYNINKMKTWFYQM